MHRFRIMKWKTPPLKDVFVYKEIRKPNWWIRFRAWCGGGYVEGGTPTSRIDLIDQYGNEMKGA